MLLFLPLLLHQQLLLVLAMFISLHVYSLELFKLLVLLLDNAKLFLFIFNVFVEAEVGQQLFPKVFEFIEDWLGAVKFCWINFEGLESCFDLCLHCVRDWEFGLETIGEEHDS